MADSKPPEEGSDTQELNLSNEDWDRYIQRIRNTTPANLEASDRRTNQRHKKFVQCVIRITDDGDASRIYLIHSRDISSEGMGFLHKGALTIGTKCVVVLETNDGSGQIVFGKVAWNREVGNGAYAAGLQFDHPIELTNFLDADFEDESSVA